MNRILIFIKNNISVFSFFSILIIILSVYELVTIDISQIRHIDPRFIFYLAIVFALLILVFDIIFKKIFTDRKKLNSVQLLISIAFLTILYFNYYN
jgi:hypothetical protein